MLASSVKVGGERCEPFLVICVGGVPFPVRRSGPVVWARLASARVAEKWGLGFSSSDKRRFSFRLLSPSELGWSEGASLPKALCCRLDLSRGVTFLLRPWGREGSQKFEFKFETLH